MQSNPTLRRLGFKDGDRVVIIHADDVGMCQASAAAFPELYEFGLVSSGAVMMPCAWALQAASYARATPQTDLGVHLTLTSEWNTYRWRALSTLDPASGLLDEEGCFYHLTAQAREHGQPEAVQRETETQVARALAAGMQPTHADTHMGVLGSAKYMLGYLKLSITQRLPSLMFHMDEAGYLGAGLGPEDAARAAGLVQILAAQGLPMLDHMVGLRLDQPEDRLGQAKAALKALQPGLTHFIIHPAKDTPELRAITPRDWASRVADYQTFMNEELRGFIKQQGIHVIGYRAVQALMPDPALATALMN